MPDVNGAKFAYAVLSINPDFPVIICTRYSASMNEMIANEIGVKKLLMKPIHRDDLLCGVKNSVGK